MNFLFCFRCRKMTCKSRTHGKVAFNDCWLSDERFKLWLKKGQDCNKAACSLCNNAVTDTATMGVCAFTPHAKGGKHQEKVRNFNPSVSLFFKRNQASVSSGSSCSAKQSNASERVDTMMNVVTVSYAEIRWVMKVLTSHFSYCFCINLNSLLASMFPDSQIAKSFQMSKTKYSPSRQLHVQS